MSDIDLLMYALCMLGLFIAAAYMAIRIINNRRNKSIEHLTKGETKYINGGLSIWQKG